MNTLIIATFGLGIVVVASIAFSWMFARMYCNPKRRSATKTPADYGLPFESVSFQSHGVTLHGWLVPSAGSSASAPTIILVHGWSNNAAQMLPVAHVLHKAGFAILMYDVRGHGASGDDGPITIAKFAEDLRAAIDYLKERPDAGATRPAVVGHSLGGSGAILAASIEPRIQAVVSSSAFADPVALTWGFMRALHIPRWPFLWLVCRCIERWLGATMTALAPRNRIGQITAPVLLIHGQSDRYIPPSNMDALYEQAQPERAERCLVPGRSHSDIIRDEQFGSRIVEFLNRRLLSEPVAKPAA